MFHVYVQPSGYDRPPQCLHAMIWSRKPNHGHSRFFRQNSLFWLVIFSLKPLINPLRLLFYDPSRVSSTAAATFRRHCSTAGDHNNPSSRRNSDTSDGLKRDLDGGNFPRWASGPCADRGTFRRFRSVLGRRDGHFSGRNGRGSCISWRGARRGVKAWHVVRVRVCTCTWGVRTYKLGGLSVSTYFRRDQVLILAHNNGRLIWEIKEQSLLRLKRM